MEKSLSIKNLAAALVKFHEKVGKVKKDADNPFFKSKYASLPNILDCINEPLTESGLTFVQLPVEENGLTTILMHSESGEFVESTYIMRPTKNDPQGIGSCITYQRRYALAAILGLSIDEDDDGNAASKTPAKKPETKATADQKKQYLNAVMNSEVFTSSEKESFLNSKSGIPYTEWSAEFLQSALLAFKNKEKSETDKLRKEQEAAV